MKPIFTENGKFPSKVTSFSQKEHDMHRDFGCEASTDSNPPNCDIAQKDVEILVGICHAKDWENVVTLLHFRRFCGILIV